jgi:PfaB family protein
MGTNGSCIHAVLEEDATQPRVGLSLLRGTRRHALFLLRGDALATEDRAALRRHLRSSDDMEVLAAEWHRSERTRGAGTRPVARAIVASTPAELAAELDRTPNDTQSVGGDVAFVFPGSGNYYRRMGRGIALALPGIHDRLEDEERALSTQLDSPGAPSRRSAWHADWESAGHESPSGRTEQIIVAQVIYGVVMHDALRLFGVVPRAFIGYSLGESTALFASRTWRDRREMLERTLSSPLFRSQLAGQKTVIRAAWGETAHWRVVVAPRPAKDVRRALVGTAALLIVNAPAECVIGGTQEDVDETVRRLECTAIALEDVPTVHLPVIEPVKAAYRAHHLLATTPPSGVRFYSGARASTYEPTAGVAADVLTETATLGFDFTKVVERAWSDGVRIFVEAGPRGSCTRMIAKILESKPHVAVSASHETRDEYETLLRAVARIAEAGAPVNLEQLYGRSMAPPSALSRAALLPPVVVGRDRGPAPPSPRRAARVDMVRAGTRSPSAQGFDLESFFRGVSVTASAHETFLRVARESFALAARMTSWTTDANPEPPRVSQPVAVAFDRQACVEFAVGKLARVLGPAFADVDSYPTRVRLPDEPLMLVDRIVTVEGAMGKLGPGRVVTEHDVARDAWYLDGGRAPVCISVEAGQADLFLSAYLGIDRQTRGVRVYRLLDAKIAFHRDLPRGGERVVYDIRIDRFIRQGDTWLFFFGFEGTIGGESFITMSDGCAGFFSPEQLAEGRGIVARPPKVSASPSRAKDPFVSLVPDVGCSLSRDALDALRRGDLGAAFGGPFVGKTLVPELRLPGGRMKLVDRIVSLDTAGGTRGLGEAVGEADVEPDAWYLTCHFVDDQVMPGTLMYECCLHTLRILLLRKGWVYRGTATGRDVHYAPVPGAASELRCRGQVTRETRVVRYQVTIDEIGYDPEPYVLATAAMFADGKHVVQMDGMSLKIRGLNRLDVESEWIGVGHAARAAFDRAKIVAYAEGNPSECFGATYAPFDRDRRLARLPRDPYLFLDRVVDVEPPPWVLAPGGWVTCAFDVAPDAWYFGASRQRTMPFAVLLEAALQPCGWLAAYLGSALTSELDLHFRNLDGEGVQHSTVHPDAGTLTTRARLTKTSGAGGMILQEFDLEVWRGDALVYRGRTGFGFFPGTALAQQVGVRGAAPWWRGAPTEGFALPRCDPKNPSDAAGAAPGRGLTLPSVAWSMVDRVLTLDLAGGPHGKGLVVGTKRVDPDEWFFRAHFFQDPVMPGSLGLEALIELAKVFALERFAALRDSHGFVSMARARAHRWQYRGQVVPSNAEVRVEAVVTSIEGGNEPVITFDGQLSVDGKIIYAMEGFSLALVREVS